MAIKAVIFDIGNVLLEWNPERFYDRVIGLERREVLFRDVELHEMNVSVDLGAHFHSSVEALAREHPDYETEILMWRDHWIEMASPEIAHSVTLLRGLRAKEIPVHALSNFGRETLEIADRHYPFLSEFDSRFISGELGLMKPDPAIYEALEAGLDLSGPELIFADDRPENIAAAAARGWQTHLFEGPEGWARRLVAEGLLSVEEAGV